MIVILPVASILVEVISSDLNKPLTCTSLKLTLSVGPTCCPTSITPLEIDMPAPAVKLDLARAVVKYKLSTPSVNASVV